MIDLHCHVLPGVDDGPVTDDEAIALARAAAQDGTRVLVATPHRSPRWPTEPDVVAAAVDRLSLLLQEAEVPLELRTGAEIALEEAARLDDGTLAALALGGGPHLLLECPHGPAGDVLERTVAELMERGHEILLAHPERCPAFQDRPARLRELVAAGARCCVTAGALAGRFGAGSQWFSLELLRDGLVHAVASDAHAPTGRPPGLRAGLDAAAERLPALAGQRRWLTTDVPAAILAGDVVPPRPG